jgi:hypothetical protein
VLDARLNTELCIQKMGSKTSGEKNCKKWVRKFRKQILQKMGSKIQAEEFFSGTDSKVLHGEEGGADNSLCWLGCERFVQRGDSGDHQESQPAYRKFACSNGPSSTSHRHCSTNSKFKTLLSGDGCTAEELIDLPAELWA